MTVKSHIFIALSLLLCWSCSKDPGQQDGAEDNNHGVDVRMRASAVEPVSWHEDDELLLRWVGESYPDASRCETLSAEESGKSAIFAGKFSEYKDAGLVVYQAAGGSFVSKSSAAIRKQFPARQSGRLEDVSDYVLSYSLIDNEDISVKTDGNRVAELECACQMRPFFAVLKLIVPSSFGYTSLKMEAGSAVSGHVQLQPYKEWGTIGSSAFAYRPTGTGLMQGTSVTVTDNGNVLGDEVYIVVAPDSYDAAAGNYCCSTESLKFTLTGPGGEFAFEKSLEGKIYNGTLVDLGKLPGRTIDISLKITDCNDVPAVVLDTAAVSNSVAYGAKYYFVTGKDGFDNLPDPTASDSELTSDGISIPVQHKSDRLYIKVFGCGEGCEDTYLKAVVRNWKYDINYIAPDALRTKYDGLDFQLGKMWSDTTYTDNRIGYIGCQAGKAVITPELEGSGWLNASFFAGSFGTTLKMFNGAKQLYRIDIPAKVYYSDNDIMKSVRLDDVDPAVAVTCEWSYRIWLRNMIFLEQAPYVSAAGEIGGGDVPIEDFDGNINYQ